MRRILLVLVLALTPALALAGAPLKGVGVSLKGAARVSATLTPNANGDFSFGILPAGTYTFEVVLTAGAGREISPLLLTLHSGRRVLTETIATSSGVTQRKSGSVIYKDDIVSDGMTAITGHLAAQ